MQRIGMTEFKVGVFVCIGLVLAMVVVFMISSEHRFFDRQYTLYAHYDDISGLRAGASVQLAGLKAGYVDDIHMSKDLNKKELIVVLRLRREFEDRIRSDSVATIETQGLLGDKFVYISIGSENEPILADDATIQSKETTSIFALADKAGKIMDDIGEAAEVVRKTLDSFKGEEGTGDLKATMVSIRKTVEQVEKGKGLAHALIYDPKGERIIASLSKTMDSVSDIVTDVDSKQKGQIGGLIGNMRRASADLQVILGKVRRGEGTVGRLINDPTVYSELSTLLGRANRSKLMRAVIRSTLRAGDRQVLTQE